MFTYNKSPGRVAGIKEVPLSQLLYAQKVSFCYKNVHVSFILHYLERIDVYYLFTYKLCIPAFIDKCCLQAIYFISLSLSLTHFFLNFQTSKNTTYDFVMNL